MPASTPYFCGETQACHLTPEAALAARVSSACVSCSNAASG